MRLTLPFIASLLSTSQSGTLRLVEISRLRVTSIARLGLLRTFQQTRIYTQMNCVENMLISVPHRNETYRTMFSKYPGEVTDKAESLLEFVGLYEKRLLISGDLSFGQQKLLEFAMALMNEPEVLLLDEPCAGLDPAARENFLQFIDELGQRRNAPTLVLVTHHVEEITPVYSHVLLLRDGLVLACGCKSQIMTTCLMAETFGNDVKLKKNSGRFRLEIQTKRGRVA